MSLIHVLTTYHLPSPLHRYSPLSCITVADPYPDSDPTFQMKPDPGLTVKKKLDPDPRKHPDPQPCLAYRV